MSACAHHPNAQTCCHQQATWDQNHCRTPHRQAEKLTAATEAQWTRNTGFARIFRVPCAIMSNRHPHYCMLAEAKGKQNMQSRRRSNHTAFNMITRLLCVFALLLVGFSHTVPAVSSKSTVDLSAYALPDGTLPVICHTPSGTDDGSSDPGFSGNCEFCRLGSAVILATPQEFQAPQHSCITASMRTVHGLAVAPVHAAGTPNRGPPGSA